MTTEADAGSGTMDEAAQGAEAFDEATKETSTKRTDGGGEKTGERKSDEGKEAAGGDDDGADAGAKTEDGEQGKQGADGDKDDDAKGKEGEGGEKKPETTQEKIEARMKVAEAAEKQNRFLTRVTVLRKDALKVAGTQEFKSWLARQSEDVQANARQNDDPETAVAVIDLYNESKSEREDGGGDAGAVADRGSQSEPQAQVVGEIPKDVLGLKFKTADGEMTFADFADATKGFGPDIAAAIVAVAQHMVSKVQAAPQQKVAGDKATTQALAEMQRKLEAMELDQQVGEAHPDARKLVKTPEWDAWMKAQPAPMKRLWQMGGAEDRVMVMDLFKESEAKRMAGEKKTEAQRRKDRHDGFHRSTMRGEVSKAGSKTQSQQSGDEVAEAKEAFNEFT